MESLKIGQVVYYVDPRVYHNPKIENLKIIGIKKTELFGGDTQIACLQDGVEETVYIWASFFGKTCFTDYEKAQAQADSQNWDIF